jgi:mobilome CxxCx(11)CxxC protein
MKGVRMDKFENVKRKCQIEAVYCYATYVIFKTKAQKLNKKLNFLAISGLVLPLSIGVIYQSFGPSSLTTDTWIILSGIYSLLQIVYSLWSSVFAWSRNYDSLIESMISNRQIYEEYERILNLAQNKNRDTEKRFEAVEARSNERSISDDKIEISQKEKRYGHRAGLMRMNVECGKCHKVPSTLESSKCEDCGNF